MGKQYTRFGCKSVFLLLFRFSFGRRVCACALYVIQFTLRPAMFDVRHFKMEKRIRTNGVDFYYICAEADVAYID